MAGFDEKIVMMNEGLSHRSDQALDKEVSLNHEQINFEENDSFEMTEEKPNSRGSLGERIAARAGFNAPKLNTQIIRSTDFSLNSDIRSPCLTISSPGLSPATLLDSPVFLSNPLAQPSPTTGKFSFFPGGNNHTLSSSPDKSKDEFFDDINTSFTFQPVSRSLPSFIPTTTTKVVPVFQNSFPNTEISIDYGNCNTFRIVEDIKPDPQNIHGNVLGSSAERYNNGNEIDQGDQNMGDYHRQDEEQREEDVGDMVAGGPPAEDGYNWRKYGQKLVKGSEYPRSYYKCTHPNCLVKKKVERSREGHITEIIYKGSHNHPKPLPNRRSAIGSSGLGVDVQQIDGTDQVDQQNGLVRDSEETSPVSGGFEYGNQSGLMQVQHEPGDATAVLDASSTFSNDDDDDDRGTHASVSLGYDGEGDETESKRRKLEAYTTEMSGATRANREPRVVVQTTSDVDILDDGYRWRKYGQKVVKGNPNPRSYYKCTAPGCTVRKHVERASHDLKAVITTYDGKHNHGVPVARTSGHGGSGTGQVGGSVTQTQSEPRHHRFDRPVNSNHHPPPFGHHPFSFQPQLGPPPGFSFDLTIPVLTFGQQNLPGFPMHPYLTAPPPPPQAPVVGESGLMLSRSTEPKVEPMSESGLGLSGSSSIYRQIMSKLPHI